MCFGMTLTIAYVNYLGPDGFGKLNFSLSIVAILLNFIGFGMHDVVRLWNYSGFFG